MAVQKSLLISEIESLPISLQQQVADFVSFLKTKYLSEKEGHAFELTEAGLAEIDRRWEEYEEAPDEAMGLLDFNQWLEQNYGLRTGNR